MPLPPCTRALCGKPKHCAPNHVYMGFGAPFEIYRKKLRVTAFFISVETCIRLKTTRRLYVLQLLYGHTLHSNLCTEAVELPFATGKEESIPY
jgi:hypothetical protein